MTTAAVALAVVAGRVRGREGVVVVLGWALVVAGLVLVVGWVANIVIGVECRVVSRRRVVVRCPALARQCQRWGPMY